MNYRKNNPLHLDYFYLDKNIKNEALDDQNIVFETKDFSPKQKKALVFETERTIRELFKLEQFDNALFLYNHFEFKKYIDPEVINLLNNANRVSFENKKAAFDLRNKTKIESEKENDLIHQIFEAYHNRDLRTAAAYFEQLKIKENIPRNIQAEIHAYNTQIANKNEEERNRLLLIKAQQDKNKKLINNLAFVAAILIIIGGGFASFIYKTPSFLYGGPPTPPVHVDSLKQAFLNHKPIKASKINNFKNSFGTDYLKYTDQNEYRRAKNIQDLKNCPFVDRVSDRLLEVDSRSGQAWFAKSICADAYDDQVTSLSFIKKAIEFQPVNLRYLDVQYQLEKFLGYEVEAAKTLSRINLILKSPGS